MASILSMRSSFLASEIPAFVKNIFGLDIVVEARLDSYDDQNFLVLVSSASLKPDNIEVICQHGYVFKILNAEDSQNSEIIDAQTRMILHLTTKGFPTPKPVLSVNGNYIEQVHATHSTKCGGTQSYSHIVRLFEFKPGKPLDKVPLTTQLCYEIGLSAGKLDLTLQTFSVTDEVSSQLKNKWNLQELPKLRSSTHVISCDEQRTVIEKIIDEFEYCLSSNYAYFSKGLIHSDLNECNIIVENLSAGNPSQIDKNQEQQNIENNNEQKVSLSDNDGYSLCGIIDFGDSTYSPYIFEVAIAIAYVMLNKHGIAPTEAAHFVLKGYLEHMKLADWEMKQLRLFICARFAQSLVLGHVAHSKHPENEYVLLHVNRIWPMLEKLWHMSNTDLLSELFRTKDNL